VKVEVEVETAEIFDQLEEEEPLTQPVKTIAEAIGGDEAKVEI
jgi:hypothetical protein